MPALSLHAYQMVLVSGFLLFFLGLLAVLIKRNVLVILMGMELMFNAVNLLLVLFNRQHGGQQGMLFVMMVMLVAAAEVAIAISIIINVYRQFRSLNLEQIDSLHG